MLGRPTITFTMDRTIFMSITDNHLYKIVLIVTHYHKSGVWVKREPRTAYLLTGKTQTSL